MRSWTQLWQTSENSNCFKLRKKKRCPKPIHSYLSSKFSRLKKQEPRSSGRLVEEVPPRKPSKLKSKHE